jgi:hypothetical protein
VREDERVLTLALVGVGRLNSQVELCLSSCCFSFFSSDYEAILSQPPPLSQADIMEVFEFYANFGRSSIQSYQDTLDSFMFMKLCREAPGLIDKKRITRTDIDLIFTKARPKNDRKLSFSHFLDALAAIAEKKYPNVSCQWYEEVL